MLNWNRLGIVGVLLAVLLAAPPAGASVQVISESISISVDLNEGDDGSDGASSSDFDVFSDSVNTSATPQSASGSVTCTDSMTLNSSASPPAEPQGGLRAEGYCTFTFVFEITDAPAPFSLTATALPSFNCEVASASSRANLNGGESFDVTSQCDALNVALPFL